MAIWMYWLRSQSQFLELKEILLELDTSAREYLFRSEIDTNFM